jgi:hypothetical protein
MKEKLTEMEYNLVSIILYAIDFVLTGYVGMYLWNNVIAVVFGVMTLSYWQVWGISFTLLYFLPKSRKINDDVADLLLKDIIYTLLVGFIVFLIVSFVGF